MSDKTETRNLTIELPEYAWQHLEREAGKEQKTVDEFVSAVLTRQHPRLYGDVAQAMYDKDETGFDEAVEKATKAYFESATHKVDSFEDDYRECIFGKGFAAGFRYGVEKGKEQ